MRAALIAIASLGLLACRGHRAPPAKPPPDAGVGRGTGTGSSARLGPITSVIDPGVLPPRPRTPMPRRLHDELLAPGRGAKHPLRYRREPSTRTLIATARITSHGYAGAWSDPVTLAPVREGFDVAIGADGALHVRGLAAEIDRTGQADAAVAAADTYLARWRALLERRRATLTVDDRGLLGDVTLLADPGGVADVEARDELVQRWLGLAVPLPDAAVGVGARWQVVTMLRTGGAVLTQTATYQLVKVERDRWTIAVELTRLGKTQTIVAPGLPPGTTAELIALVRKVSGTVTVSPTSPLPLTGELAAEVRSHARFTAVDTGPRDQYSEDKATITLASPSPPASPAPAPTAPTPAPAAPPTPAP